MCDCEAEQMLLDDSGPMIRKRAEEQPALSRLRKQQPKSNPRRGCSGVEVGVGGGTRAKNPGSGLQPLCIPTTLTFLSLSFRTHREQGTTCFLKLPGVLGTERQVHMAGIQKTWEVGWGGVG